MATFEPARRGLSRRRFLQEAARFGAILGGACVLVTDPAGLLARLAGESGRAVAGTTIAELLRHAPEARYWTSTDADGVDCALCHTPDELAGGDAPHHARTVVRCLLCAQGCVIAPGRRGRCGARLNHDGTLRTLSYGHPIASHVDPVEKKPFYHFLPGRQAASIATAGCPLSCKFCQNHEISQARPEDHAGRFVPPSGVVDWARDHEAPIIAFTYNEPTVFVEYLTDIARLARRHGLRPALVSCGIMTEAPLAEMCECLDAIKIDLKGFSPAFYRDVTGSELQPVLRSIEQVARSDCHLEIVNLVVPTLNDSDAMLRDLARWVMDTVGPDVPLHFTRFHPDYQLVNLAPTPVATLERARDIARDVGLRYAYVGNVPGHPGNQTYCPRCGEVVIERRGFFVRATNLADGRCRNCRQPIAGVWE